MADFTAKDVQALRQASGAGMMDAKKALQETDGDAGRAKKLLREWGLGKADDRSDRENAQGAIAIATNGHAVGLVELKCETDFVAKSPNFVALTQALADSVAVGGDPRWAITRTPSTTSRSPSRRTSRLAGPSR